MQTAVMTRVHQGGHAVSSDLPRLARALEYLDMASALYVAGGADHSAQLLAAAGRCPVHRMLGGGVPVVTVPAPSAEPEESVA